MADSITVRAYKEFIKYLGTVQLHPYSVTNALCNYSYTLKLLYFFAKDDISHIFVVNLMGATSKKMALMVGANYLLTMQSPVTDSLHNC